MIERLKLNENARQLIKLALPIVGTTMLFLLYQLTDMFWVGELGSNSVAAIGTASFFINLGWSLLAIMTGGANIKISHSVGEKSPENAKKYASTAIYAVIVLAIISSVLTILFMHDLIGFFKVEKEIHDSSVNYLFINALAYVISFTNMLFFNIFNAHGASKLSFLASMSGILANIILDPIFIFTFDLGVEGAAYATIISSVITFIVTINILKKHKEINVEVKTFNFNKLKTMLRLGVPTSIRRISFILIYIMLGRIISNWGGVAIAVQKLGVQIEAISFMFIGGFAQAVGIMTGHKFGAKEYSKLRDVYNQGIKISLAIGIATTIIFLTIPDLLFSVFVSEPETINMGKAYLIIVGLSQVFMSVEMITNGAYGGIGKTQVPAVVSISITVLRLPLAYILGFYTSLGLSGVWLSISITSVIKGILIRILYNKELKQHKYLQYATVQVSDHDN